VLMSVVGAAPDSAVELSRMKYVAEQRAWEWSLLDHHPRDPVHSCNRRPPPQVDPLVFGHCDNPINFVSVVDVAELVEQVSVDSGTRSKVLEICGPNNLTLRQLAVAVQHSAGRTTEPRHVPRTLLHVIRVALGPFKPDLARQAQAALTLDTADLTFNARSLDGASVQIAQTTVSDVLGGGQRSSAPALAAKTNAGSSALSLVATEIATENSPCGREKSVLNS
jgi:hypothetical protein